MCNRRYRWNINIHTHTHTYIYIFFFFFQRLKAVGVREVLMEKESFEMGSERYLGYIKTMIKEVQEETREWTILWRQENWGLCNRDQGTAGLSEVCQGQKRQEIRLERRYRSRLCECSRLSLACLWYLVDTSSVKPKPRVEGIELGKDLR